MTDKSRGLYGKFIVERTDGSSVKGGKHESCRYFVLDIDHDPLAQNALCAYSKDARLAGYGLLANDLDEIIRQLSTPQGKAGEREITTSAEAIVKFCESTTFPFNEKVAYVQQALWLLESVAIPEGKAGVSEQRTLRQAVIDAAINLGKASAYISAPILFAGELAILEGAVRRYLAAATPSSVEAPLINDPVRIGPPEDDFDLGKAMQDIFAPEPQSPRVCVKCGHDGLVGNYCAVFVDKDNIRGFCGCKCVFP